MVGTEEFQEFASEAKSIVTWRCWVSNLLESMARFVRGSIEDDTCLDHVSSHWEGGAGSRNTATMSSKDSKKFKSKTKTESKKNERVGAKAKQAREHKRVFGD